MKGPISNYPFYGKLYCHFAISGQYLYIVIEAQMFLNSLFNFVPHQEGYLYNIQCSFLEEKYMATGEFFYSIYRPYTTDAANIE